MKKLRDLVQKIFPTIMGRNYRTVHFAFSFLAVFIAVMGMASVISQTKSYIRITTSATQIETGTKFSVDVYAFASTPVNAITIGITFPNAAVEVLGIDRGESVITIWTKAPYVDNGTVYLEGGTYRKGFIGEHKIATIKLMAKMPGKAEFVVTNAKLLAGDGKGTPVATDESLANASAYIYDTGTNPNTINGTANAILLTDIDGDNKVTFKDITAFMMSWIHGGVRYDFNNDGYMTIRDFSILLATYFYQI